METQLTKLEILILYICAKVPHRILGKTKLNKMLYYSDRNSMRLFAKPISDTVYVKGKYGPVPQNIDTSIENLKKYDCLIARKEEDIYINSPRMYNQWEFIVLIETPLIFQMLNNVFTPAEIAIVDRMVSAISDMTANEVSEASHDELWHLATMGEEIPYEAMLLDEEYVADTDALEFFESVANEYSGQAA